MSRSFCGMSVVAWLWAGDAAGRKWKRQEWDGKGKRMDLGRETHSRTGY